MLCNENFGFNRMTKLSVNFLLRDYFEDESELGWEANGRGCAGGQ